MNRQYEGEPAQARLARGLLHDLLQAGWRAVQLAVLILRGNRLVDVGTTDRWQERAAVPVLIVAAVMRPTTGIKINAVAVFERTAERIQVAPEFAVLVPRRPRHRLILLLVQVLFVLGVAVAAHVLRQPAGRQGVGIPQLPGRTEDAGLGNEISLRGVPVLTVDRLLDLIVGEHELQYRLHAQVFRLEPGRGQRRGRGVVVGEVLALEGCAARGAGQAQGAADAGQEDIGFGKTTRIEPGKVDRRHVLDLLGIELLGQTAEVHAAVTRNIHRVTHVR